MNSLDIQLTPAEINLVLELLKPYAELSVNLSNQYKARLFPAAKPVRAKKVEDNISEEKIDGNN